MGSIIIKVGFALILYNSWTALIAIWVAFRAILATAGCYYTVYSNIAEFKAIIVLARVYSIVRGFSFKYLYLVYNAGFIEFIYKVDRVYPYN